MPHRCLIVGSRTDPKRQQPTRKADQQLTKPGSVPPAQQLKLIMADRTVHDNRSITPASPKRCWSPFKYSLDLSPHRALTGLRRVQQEPGQLTLGGNGRSRTPHQMRPHRQDRDVQTGSASARPG